MYTTTNIATLIDAQLTGKHGIAINWLLTDSRSLCFPAETLFFAIVTPRGDGHQFIPSLYRSGVRAFVVSTLPQDVSPEGDFSQGDFPEADFLLVPDTLSALQRLAERHRERFNIPVIGITGSNGKTTVKEWLYQMLSPDYVVTRSPRSYNSQIGVPLSVWSLNAQSQIAIFEAGISQPGEMDALQRIIQPTIGVFTGLGDAHQENFESMEQKYEEKMKLFRDVEVLFTASPPSPLPVMGGGVDTFCLGKGKQEAEQSISQKIQVIGQATPPPITGRGLGGEAYAPFNLNLSLCAAVCRHLGMDEATIQERLANLQPVAMRLEVKEGRNGCTVINDSYNSDLGSLQIALDFMHRRPDVSQRRHNLILSDIEQNGMPADELYAHVASLVRKRQISRFIGIGPQLCASAHLFQETGADCHFLPTTDALLQSTLCDEFRDEVVLVKGARHFQFERVTERMEMRVHETILEVDLSAMKANLDYYRSFLRRGTKMICMIKASGYGAGSVEIARMLQDAGVDYLAVAVADEGAELRRAGITAGIIIMNPEMTSFRTLFRYNLEPEVYSFRLLNALVREAEKEGVTGFPVHVKLDTGMHRMGFDPERDMPALIDRFQHQDALLPRSVFSHFVGSDDAQFDQFSARQFDLFLRGSDALQAAFPYHILRHICNSAAIEHFPERQLDMVRLGLGLYGINPRTNALINNVSTLRTTILQIHDVPAEETVGYSRRGLLRRDSRIASLPIGYADGLDRHLGNGHAYCLVNGQRAPYVGNICMDVCMVDVTDIDCEEGDEAIIFGRDLPVTILSDAVGTIPYEILTGISPRVKRVYFRE